jgi:hypothetical protein
MLDEDMAHKKEVRNMPDDFPWIQFLTTVFAGIAVVISMWSLKYSYDATRIGKDANKISQEALKQARQAFIEDQRPHLQLKPAVKGGVALQCRQEKRNLFFILNINMRNNGKTAARNITCLRDSMKLVIPGIEYDAGDSESPTVASSLGPGQDFNLKRRISASSSDLDKLVEIIEAWKEGHVYINADIALKYTGNLGENEYSVCAQYKVTKQNDFIIDYKSD